MPLLELFLLRLELICAHIDSHYSLLADVILMGIIICEHFDAKRKKKFLDEKKSDIQLFCTLC